MNNKKPSQEQINLDEVDIIKLVKQLYEQKIVIIVSMIIVLFCAIIYVFLTGPIYVSKAAVQPPSLSDISGYNLGREEAKLPLYSVADVFSVFKRNLLSQSSKREFFNSVYLPSLDKASTAKSNDRLWSDFNKIFNVYAADAKNTPDYYVVSVEHDVPEVAAKWANLYVKMISNEAADEMQKNLLTEIDTRVDSLDRQITALRATARTRREDSIIRLQEALVVADAVGLDDPQVVSGRTSSSKDIASYIDGSLMYMRGAKAMRAELEVLRNRKNDDPFISELRNLENQLYFLKAINVNPDNVKSFKSDGRALVPDSPIKPNKLIIVAVSIALGLALGIIFALVRSSYMSRTTEL